MFGLGWRKAWRKVAQSHRLGLRPSAQGQAKGPPTPGKPPLQTGLLVGPWQLLHPLGRPRLPADSCVCSGMWKILQWGAFSLKPASEVAPWDFRSTSPQGPTHLAEPPAGRQSGSLFCSGEKGQGGPGWGQSEAQAWLRVGLALELVPDSGMRRTLSSDWPSVRL